MSERKSGWQGLSSTVVPVSMVVSSTVVQSPVVSVSRSAMPAQERPAPNESFGDVRYGRPPHETGTTGLHAWNGSTWVKFVPEVQVPESVARRRAEEAEMPSRLGPVERIQGAGFAFIRHGEDVLAFFEDGADGIELRGVRLSLRDARTVAERIICACDNGTMVEPAASASSEGGGTP